MPSIMLPVCLVGNREVKNKGDIYYNVCGHAGLFYISFFLIALCDIIIIQSAIIVNAFS